MQRLKGDQECNFIKNRDNLNHIIDNNNRYKNKAENQSLEFDHNINNEIYLKKLESNIELNGNNLKGIYKKDNNINSLDLQDKNKQEKNLQNIIKTPKHNKLLMMNKIYDDINTNLNDMINEFNKDKRFKDISQALKSEEREKDNPICNQND